MLLGCIGDDFTGSSDLGNTLARAGMRVVQFTGVPDAPALPSVEAGVIALKIRSVPAADAVEQALKALDWLRAQGCRQFFWKYCSTFDSTAEGNIGPVAEALSHALGLDGKPVVFCPAFPGTGRTICMGHLFVGDRLLNESGMEAHPPHAHDRPGFAARLGRAMQHRGWPCDGRHSAEWCGSHLPSTSYRGRRRAPFHYRGRLGRR